LAAVSTINPENSPEAALVGIVVSPDLETIFDTFITSREYHNLVQNLKVAIVIDWDDETTVQYEGLA